jgi:hypothetical protein
METGPQADFCPSQIFSGQDYSENTPTGRAGTPGRGGMSGNDLRLVMKGPAIDFWVPPLGNAYDNVLNWLALTSQLYSQNSRGILAYRGEVTQQRPGKRSRIVGLIGNQEELGGYQRINDWNQMRVVVCGRTFLNSTDGRLMSAMVDDDPASTSNGSGLVGLQIETAPCKIGYRNIWLKKIN